MMKRTDDRIAVPVSHIIGVVAILVIVLIATVIFSFATSDKKITPAAVEIQAVEPGESQDKQWKRLALVMMENSREMAALTRTLSERGHTMNAVEHMNYQSRIVEAHLAQLREVAPRFETLYAAMSVSEKTRLDRLFQTGKWNLPE
jgi:hypothetical protein